MVQKVHVLRLGAAMPEVSLLYIEDDALAQKHYSSGFPPLFQNIYLAADAKRGFEIYQKEQPDILLVDIELPDESGLSLIEKIREKDKETIIIILSSFSQRELLLQAVSLGLYQYLIKPVRNSELLKVMNEVIMITQKKKKSRFLRLAEGIYWNSDACSLYENENEISLTKNENALIALLHSDKNKVFSLETIAYRLGERELPSSQAIKNLINRLRKKVSVDFIHNHYGVGYQLIN